MRRDMSDIKETTSGAPTEDEGSAISFTLAGLMKNSTVMFDALISPHGRLFLPKTWESPGMSDPEIEPD